MGLQSAPLAVVSDDVAVVLRVEDIVHFYDMRVLQLLQYFYLALQQLVIPLAHRRQFYHLYCVQCFLVVVLAALVHLAAVPAPDQVAKVIGVASDSFFAMIIGRLLAGVKS